MKICDYTFTKDFGRLCNWLREKNDRKFVLNEVCTAKAAKIRQDLGLKPKYLADCWVSVHLNYLNTKYGIWPLETILSPTDLAPMVFNIYFAGWYYSDNYYENFVLPVTNMLLKPEHLVFYENM